MKKCEIKTKSNRYWICPECGEYCSTVDHLIDLRHTTETRWGCDSCGTEFKLKFGFGNMYAEKTGYKWLNTIVVLKRGDITLIVKGRHYTEREMGAAHEYFYNEHTCPINYLTDVLIVMEGEDTDPHGIFEYVSTHKWDDRIKDGNLSIEKIKEIIRTRPED